MLATNDPDPVQLMLARSLFRADKWDPARTADHPFEWDAMRAAYLRKSGRLLRTFEKDGLQVAPA